MLHTNKFLRVAVVEESYSWRLDLSTHFDPIVFVTVHLLILAINEIFFAGVLIKRFTCEDEPI